MEPLIIQSTLRTPYVCCDTSKKTLEMSGIITSNNSNVFFKPIYEWLDQYSQTNQPIVVNFRFQYYNTSASLCLLRILKKLESIHQIGVNVSVNWYYHESDMFDVGKSFRGIIKIPFKLKECENYEEYDLLKVIY